MRRRAQFHPRLFVQREAVDQVGAGTVIADHLYLLPVAAQLADGCVERIDASDVPEIGSRHGDRKRGEHAVRRIA